MEDLVMVCLYCLGLVKFILNILFLNFSEMAANSDGTTQLVTTIVTCEGDLNDPQFNQQFDKIVKDLNKLLFQGKFIIFLLKNVIILLSLIFLFFFCFFFY